LPVQLGVVTASAIVSGISAATSVKSVSGPSRWTAVTGAVDARTVSGDIEAQGLGGTIGFNSVSGDLTLADGAVDRLDAKTVSGRVTADIELDQDAALRVATVSGPVAIRLPARRQRPGGPPVRHGRVLSEFPGLRHSQKPGASTLSGDCAPGAAGVGPGRHPGMVRVSTMSARSRCCQRGEPGPPRAAAEAAGAAGEPRFRHGRLGCTCSSCSTSHPGTATR